MVEKPIATQTLYASAFTSLPFFPLYQYQLSRVLTTKLTSYNWCIIKMMSVLDLVIPCESNVSLITIFLL